MIKPFKVRVSPAESEIIQNLLFENNISWLSESKRVMALESPFLYIGAENSKHIAISHGIVKINFINYGLPERSAKNVIRNLKRNLKKPVVLKEALVKANKDEIVSNGHVYSKKALVKGFKDFLNLYQKKGTGQLEHLGTASILDLCFKTK